MYDMSVVGFAATNDTDMAVTTELAIAGYFFARQSCKFTTTSREGRTKIIDLQGITFRD